MKLVNKIIEDANSVRCALRASKQLRAELNTRSLSMRHEPTQLASIFRKIEKLSLNISIYFMFNIGVIYSNLLKD